MKTYFLGFKKMAYCFMLLISMGILMLSSCEKPPAEDLNNGSGGGTSGGSGGGSGNGWSTSGIPKTGSFGIKVYNPTGACANTISGYKGWIKGYYYCPAQYPATCGYVLGDIPPPSGAGQTDGGGLYWYALYGDNPQAICRGTMYRIEWEFTPNKLNYPTSCVISGSSSIDFQGQSKLVVIRWP